MPETPTPLFKRHMPLNAMEIVLGVDVFADLMARTSEMLAMPLMTCGIRRCRRSRSCLRIPLCERLPVCKAMLTEDEDKGFYAIFGLVVSLYEFSRDGDDRALVFILTRDPPDFWPAAVGIVRQVLPPGAPGHRCIDAAVAAAKCRSGTESGNGTMPLVNVNLWSSV
ncbi:hypothetical protein [Rhizobium sp. Root1220]|uniref:hypothetical protein n=1 Tax=Rhizobium sp. Root1220 TaxID=1736432 RepID=UPI0006FD0352|nr:hypothetical protein [Rhizobium sp. Root1220]KQV81741.1 hypothetical protein ASC90_05395 [Rhizobium sp. Root1220]